MVIEGIVILVVFKLEEVVAAVIVMVSAEVAAVVIVVPSVYLYHLQIAVTLAHKCQQ